MDYSIFDHMIEGVQIIDRDFRYVYVNEAVAKHGRADKASLLGATMTESYPGIERSDMFAHIRACLEEQRAHQMINEFTFPDGGTGYFQLRMQPIPEGVLILSFDITAQKRAELKTQELNAILEARVQDRTAALQARNEELEQIAYVASHDLQEPLRTIRGFVDVLDEGYRDQLVGEGHTALAFITEAATWMQQLVRALLDFSRLGRTRELEPIDVGGGARRGPAGPRGAHRGAPCDHRVRRAPRDHRVPRRDPSVAAEPDLQRGQIQANG